MGGKPHILAIDNGTQSVRALLFDLDGNLVDGVRLPLAAGYSKKPGWSEQEVDYFWERLCCACHRLWRTTGVSRESLAGMAVTTQRACMINLDRDGRPLRPMISWLDQRRTGGLKPIGGWWGMLFRLAGVMDTVRYLQAETEVNWLVRHQPEIWEKTHKYLMLSGYLNYRLTGEFRDSVGSMVGYLPFDYKRLHWSKKNDWKWRLAPFDEDKLVELVPPSAILGRVTDKAGEETGLPRGLPVIAAATDKACEVLGAGALDPETACLSYGTTATINTISHRYIEPVRLIPPYPAPIPNAYCTEVMIYRGYWMVNWFKEQFAHREQKAAEEQGVTPEELFEDLVNQVPPASMGLLLQPYWSPGLRMPEAKGAVIGFGDVHDRAHLYRAILEGLAYGLREGGERIEKKSGIAVKQLIVAGGGSQSDAAMQLTADIFNRPAYRPHVYEASGLGAAIDAAVGLELYPDFEAAVKNMTRIDRVFEPNDENCQIYDEMYRSVYRKMYRKLRPLYRRIQEITGYPERD